VKYDGEKLLFNRVVTPTLHTYMYIHTCILYNHDSAGFGPLHFLNKAGLMKNQLNIVRKELFHLLYDDLRLHWRHKNVGHENLPF